VSYSGCSFDIPSLQHDEVYIDSTPNPFRSIGHAEAYCFDGELTIKSRSCQVSCESSFPAKQWLPESAGDPGQCAHSNLSSPLRMSPGSTRLIENEYSGMAGNITYTCDEGVARATSSTCKPKACEGVAASSWTGSDGATCSHTNVAGFWEDGETVDKDSDNNPFVSTGHASYVCEGGSMRRTSSVCEEAVDVIPCVSHQIDLPAQDGSTGTVGGESPSPLEPPYIDICEEVYGDEFMEVNGACCSVTQINGAIGICYQIP
tara:strand:- start:1078 stop:1860 length:783 start_codon:yes stop_codon:yes gene_type:complete